MIAIFLTLTLLMQGIPVPAAQGGTVTGILKTADGKPATGVRVSAMAQPESLQDTTGVAALVSIGETDGEGRYALESIPQGRYYIVAGRVDQPTYYPGTLEIAGGTVVTIAPGITVPHVDFVMKDSSGGRPTNTLANPPLTVPIQISIEGGGKIPVFAAGRFPMLRVTRVVDGMRTEAPLNAPTVTVPSISQPEYRFSIENLPEGYVVKSMMFGSTDLTTRTLLVLVPSSTWSAQANALAAASPGTVLTSPSSTTGLSVTLAVAATASSAVSGVRVAGRIKDSVNRSIYLSGIPGALYSDGTWEFRGVPPGRHTIVTLDNPTSVRSVGVSLVVGDRDVAGVELEEMLVLPFNIKSPPSPELSGGEHPPGSVVPLVSIRGRVVDEGTGEPLNAGRVIVNSDSLAYSLDSDGKFEIRRLLPGRYNLEIWAYGVGSVSKIVVVDDEDIDLDFSLRGAN